MLDRWQALLARVSGAAPGDASRACFQRLQSLYGSADRGYHNARHITACLQLLDSVRGLAQQPDLVELAIWFHDAIYDSHRPDNEACSARLAMDALATLGVPASACQCVSDLILATRHHAPPANADAALLVDIDLAILGQSAEAFDAYEAGIQFEYAWVPEADFRAGRSRILQAFLNRDRLYNTEHFRTAYESTARANLTRSLARLAAK